MRRSLLVAVCCGACFDEPGASSSGDATDATGTDATTNEPSTGSTSSGDLDHSDTSATHSDSLDDGSSSDAPIVARCGNGITEPGEDCDDANADPLDGCTSACTNGPRDLTMMVATPPDVIGWTLFPVNDYGSCLGQLRGPGLVTAMSGGRGGTDESNAWPTSVTAACAKIVLQADELESALVVMPDAAMLGPVGVDGGQAPWQIACPVGEVAIGIGGRVYPGQPNQIVALRFACGAMEPSPLSPAGVAITPTQPSPWTESSVDGEEQMRMCPEGSIVVGMRGDIDAGDAAVFRFGPLCASPVVAFGPP